MCVLERDRKRAQHIHLHMGIHPLVSPGFTLNFWFSSHMHNAQLIAIGISGRLQFMQHWA